MNDTARRPIASVAQVTGLQAALNARVVPSHGGRVIFRFDDGFKSVRTLALPEMQKRGLVGFAAPITFNIGSGDYMTAADLQALVEAGWEVGSHAHNHVDATTLTAAQFGADLDASIAALVAAGVPYPETFTYVGGARNATTDKEVYYRFRKCFSTLTALSVPDPARPTFMLPSGIGVGGGVSESEDLEIQKRYIERRLAAGQHAVLIYHDFTTGTPTLGTQCPLATFTALLDWIAARNYPVGLPRLTAAHSLLDDALFARYDIAATAHYSTGFPLIGPWHFGRADSKMLRVSDGAPPFGTHAISFDSTRNGAAAFDYVQQWVPVIPGKVYRWRYWENVPEISANDLRGVLVPYNCLGGSLATTNMAVTNAPTAGWVQRTGTWTAPANTDYVLFRWQSSTATGRGHFAAPAFYLSDAYDFMA